jgi:hypothetical protein
MHDVINVVNLNNVKAVALHVLRGGAVTERERLRVLRIHLRIAS